jgi:hypothetical protein
MFIAHARLKCGDRRDRYRHCPSVAASNLRHAIHIKAMAPVGLYAIFGLRMLSCHARNLDLGTLNATVLRTDHPTHDRRVRHDEPALGHPGHEISVAQPVR